MKKLLTSILLFASLALNFGFKFERIMNSNYFSQNYYFNFSK